MPLPAAYAVQGLSQATPRQKPHQALQQAYARPHCPPVRKRGPGGQRFQPIQLVPAIDAGEVSFYAHLVTPLILPLL